MLQSILVLKIYPGLIDNYARRFYRHRIVQRVAVSLARTTTARALKYNYHVPKATQVILVIELYDMSFSYHMEDFLSYRTLKFYAIRKYSFYLLTNEIVAILSTE